MTLKSRASWHAARAEPKELNGDPARLFNRQVPPLPPPTLILKLLPAREQQLSSVRRPRSDPRERH